MEWRLAVSLLGIKMINDTCFSNHVHLFPPVWLKFLLWSTWGSYHSRFFILMPFTKPLESICSWMRAPLSLSAILRVPDWVWALWCFVSLCLDLFYPPLCIHQAPGFLMCLRDCAGALAALAGITPQEHSESGCCSVPCHTSPKSKGHRGMKGLALSPDPALSWSQGLSSPSGRSLGGSALRNIPADGRAGVSGELSIFALNSLDSMEVPPGAWIKSKLALLPVPHCGGALAFISPNETLNPLSSRGLLPSAFTEQQDFCHSASVFSSDPGNVKHLLLSHQGSELSWVCAATASLLPGLLSAEGMKNALNSQWQI